MSVSTVQSTTQNTSTTSSTDSTRNTGELGKDQFLQLLVTQLKYQNPLEPMDDTSFIAQMAQFSSLEQMQNMNSTFSSMKAFSLMGKSITATLKNEETGEVTLVEGVVEKVKIESGKASVLVNGKDVPVEQITEVNDAAASKITDLMTLLGKNVSATVSDGTNSTSVSGEVAGINKVSGVDYIELKNVELNDVDVVMPEYVTQYKKDYMEDNINKKITLKVKNSEGKEVEVTGTLIDVVEQDGKLHALLDGVSVPVNNISGIVQ